MFESDAGSDLVDIIEFFDVDELGAVFFDSGESVEVLDKVLADLEGSLCTFGFDEQSSMELHDFENLGEGRATTVFEEAPRISETSTSDHESIDILGSFSSVECASFFIAIIDDTRTISRMYDLGHSVEVTHDVSVGDHGDIQVLFESVDPGEIRLSREGLFVGATVDGNEIGTRVFESFAEINQEIMIFPSESCLHRDRDLHGFGHFFYDLEGSIAVDHER